MRAKYLILAGLFISLALLVIAALYYPGGSQLDKNSIGYDWKNNYLSNLFGPKAVNGADNTSRPWSAAGMLVLSVSCALFFIEFSKKIPAKGAAGIIRYFGAGAMVFTFLAITPLHDIMVTLAFTAALVSMFYITVFVFKAKLYVLAALSVVCLLFFYSSNYIYTTRTHLEILPVMQKATFALTITWMLSLLYFTTSADFAFLQPKSKAVSEKP